MHSICGGIRAMSIRVSSSYTYPLNGSEAAGNHCSRISFVRFLSPVAFNSSGPFSASNGFELSTSFLILTVDWLLPERLQSLLPTPVIDSMNVSHLSNNQCSPYFFKLSYGKKLCKIPLNNRSGMHAGVRKSGGRTPD